MRHFVRLFSLLLLLTPGLAQAKHVAPPEVHSITNSGVRYVVPNDKGLRAYVEVPPFGTPCMRYEYLSSMVLEKDELRLTSERGRVYTLNIRTKAVRRVKTEDLNKITGSNHGQRSEETGR
jgi:hypothetical protein